MTTIEELEKELERFHSNIAGSNKLIETLQSVIEAINAEREEHTAKTASLLEALTGVPEQIKISNEAIVEEFSKTTSSIVHKEHLSYIETIEVYIAAANSERENYTEKTNSLLDTFSSIPEIIQKSNQDTSEEYAKKVSETVVAEHAAYMQKIDAYICSLTEIKEFLSAKQTSYLESLTLIQQNFSNECQSYKEELLKIKIELHSDTANTMNAITAENARICQDYLTQIRGLSDKASETVSVYSQKVKELTESLASSESYIKEQMVETQRKVVESVSECQKTIKDSTDSFDKNVRQVTEELREIVGIIKKDNETFVSQVERIITEDLQSIKEKDEEVLTALSEIKANQKKSALLLGCGIFVAILLGILSFFI